jgi:hypothetical protein
MATIALLLKSYSGDFNYAQRLVASFQRHNAEGLKLYVVVPESDLEQFAALNGANIEILGEHLLGQYLTDAPVHGLRPGYINQEIIKLAFWELGLADNYFCVDSDAEFIRDFGFADFMVNDTTPYTVLVEDKELLVEPRYYEQYWKTREHEIRHIQELIGLDTRVIRTCHGHQVFSAAVLRSFKENFLQPRGWSYVDALAESPYEFSWYNLWLQKDKTIEIHTREPLVKVFHHEGHHLEYILRGITQADIARGYLAIVVNSNYSRDLGVVESSASKPESLGRYLSYGEVGQLLASKFKDTFRRRLS